MSSPNIGWLFYKDYFTDLIYEDFKETNEDSIKFEKRMEKKYKKELNILGDAPFDKVSKKEWEEKKHCILYKNKCMINKKIDKLINIDIVPSNIELGNIHFKATTTYPGLLLGTGIDHKLPDIEGQAILGFTFDYTTGLPTIPASSIKGVLRSAFRHTDYIQFLLDDETFDVKALELEIFGQDNGAKKISQGRDIFFDAVVVSGGKILGDDYLAPHGSDALKNPVPLRFIKVLPDVTFRFDFELTDGILEKERKTILFAQILSDLGIGAKSNVGYGKFSSNLVSKAKLAVESQKEEELKKEKEREAIQKAENEAKILSSLDSNVEKIQIQIKDFTKKETKNIHDIIVTYELNDSEKKELIAHLRRQIGEKPKSKKRAPIKWAIKIYELLEQ